MSRERGGYKEAHSARTGQRHLNPTLRSGPVPASAVLSGRSKALRSVNVTCRMPWQPNFPFLCCCSAPSATSPAADNTTQLTHNSRTQSDQGANLCSVCAPSKPSPQLEPCTRADRRTRLATRAQTSPPQSGSNGRGKGERAQAQHRSVLTLPVHGRCIHLRLCSPSFFESERLAEASDSPS